MGQVRGVYVHACAPASEILPLAHLVHCAAPAAEKVPGAQLTQADTGGPPRLVAAVSACVPAGQEVAVYCSAAAPSAGVPAAQKPALQGCGAVAAALQVWPGGHAPQKEPLTV